MTKSRVERLLTLLCSLAEDNASPRDTAQSVRMIKTAFSRFIPRVSRMGYP